MGKRLDGLLREIMRAAKVARSKEEAEREKARRLTLTINLLKSNEREK
jgi:hypothetical protein